MLYKLDTAIVFSDISDHLPIFMRFEIKFQKRKCIDVTSKPVFSTATIEEFNLSLQEEDWSCVSTAANNNDDPTSAYSLFFAKYKALFEKHFRTQKLPPSRSDAPRQVWITRGLINSCKKKSIFYKKKTIQNHTPENVRNYILYRNKLTTLLRKAKKKLLPG